MLWEVTKIIGMKACHSYSYSDEGLEVRSKVERESPVYIPITHNKHVAVFDRTSKQA